MTPEAAAADHAESAAPWSRPLFWLGAAYVFFHHVGTLLAPLGEVGDTRWADWVDLLAPYVVVGLGVLTLTAAHAPPRCWGGFALAAVIYTQGHGIHLAANSVGNVARSDIAHFWDEYVGHYIWYAGLALMFAVLAGVLAARPLHRCPPPGHLLAALVGLTHFTNSIEGDFALPGLAVAAGFTAWGVRTRRHAGRLLLTAYGFALVLFAVYGGWHRGFPEFSDLGWI